MYNFVHRPTIKKEYFECIQRKSSNARDRSVARLFMFPQLHERMHHKVSQQNLPLRVQFIASKRARKVNEYPIALTWSHMPLR